MTASQTESPEGVGTLVANAVEQMERMILSGDLPPGAKLREVALAQAIGVGRGPLREAIRILEGRRLLQRTPNAGVSVIAPSLDDFEQLLVTREALEGMAARLAAWSMPLKRSTPSKPSHSVCLTPARIETFTETLRWGAATCALHNCYAKTCIRSCGFSGFAPPRYAPIRLRPMQSTVPSSTASSVETLTVLNKPCAPTCVAVGKRYCATCEGLA